MGLNLRTIANFCLILVIIGFCMPMAKMPIIGDMNGFAVKLFSLTDGNNLLSVSLYVLFISAIIGIFIGILLFMVTIVPIFINWLNLIICIVSFIIPFFMYKNIFENNSGNYIIILGLISSFIFLLIASFLERSSKICPTCGRELPLLNEEKIIQYQVIIDTDIKLNPDIEASVVTKILSNNIVEYMSEAYNDSQIKKIWYKVKYNENTGWCLSENLKKLEA